MAVNTRPYQKVGAQLKQQLTDGHYVIGDRFPPEREIAAHLNVSRTVVREAIIMLELEELIEVRMGSGTYVLNLPNQIKGKAPKVKFSDVGPFEMLQARQLLESNIAEFAAVQVTPSDIIKMRNALELEKQELANQYIESEGDKNFHLYIAEATQNSVLVEMFKFSWGMRESSAMWSALHTRINTIDYRREWLTDHEKILSALQRKDSISAKNAMWQHLENVKNILFELSDTEDPDFDGYLFSSNPVVHLNQR
ncbi:FCD domain-containing protein [Psychromonas sp. PT13]|uniref:FCD domain-containing protein n=1 Tax=Psychromonas sp. PT13 TaxID=3439547 RepID=UPI003EBF1B89